MGTKQGMMKPRDRMPRQFKPIRQLRLWEEVAEQLKDSILSGDLLGNDSNLTDTNDLITDSNRSDNCYHVVTANNTGFNTMLDGFVITGGYADGPVGQISNFGGGFYSYNSGCTISNCIIRWNLAGYGGGIYSYGNQLNINECTLRNNWAYEVGGAIRNTAASNPALIKCVFSENQSQSYGGAIANSGASKSTLIDCSFAGNKAQYGGAMHNYANSNPTISNCIFTDNQATDTGGAIRNYECNDINITNSLFSMNEAQYGGAVYNFDSNSLIVDCNFALNSATNGGGAICDSSSNSMIFECVFNGNQSDKDGGALYNNSSNGVINNCIFRNNIGTYDSGAIYNITSSSPEIINCLFAANSAYSGGAISNKSSSNPNFVNCTIVRNTALGGGGIFNDGGTCSVTNCILWDNHNSTQIFPPGSATVNYSCVQGYSGGGAGNITAEPRFVNPAGTDGIIGTYDDDFRLLDDSLCIDSADNNSVPVNITTALDGRDRIISRNCGPSPRVDMGAYEYTLAYYGDLDGQCDVNFVDLAILGEAWMSNYADENFNPLSDIAPWPVDGKIDMLDVKALVENWLMVP